MIGSLGRRKEGSIVQFLGYLNFLTFLETVSQLINSLNNCVPAVIGAILNMNFLFRDLQSQKPLAENFTLW